MNENLTYIAVVLDESTSMHACLDETIKGFNAFMAEQAKLPGECKVTLTKFNTYVPAPVFVDRDLKDMPRLNRENYVPQGWTALLDAVGITIDQLGARLAAMPEKDRPGKVIVVVMTDGEENKSRSYRLEQIRSMIQHQTAKYNWAFTFLGAGPDAFNQGLTLGFAPAATMAYDVGNTGAVYTSVNAAVTNLRLGATKSIGYTQADRAAAVTPNADASWSSTPAIPVTLDSTKQP